MHSSTHEEKSFVIIHMEKKNKVMSTTKENDEPPSTDNIYRFNPKSIYWDSLSSLFNSKNSIIKHEKIHIIGP